MYKKGRVNSNSRIISTDEDPSLRIESSAIINLRGVSTKLNKYIVFTMQTYKKLIKFRLFMEFLSRTLTRKVSNRLVQLSLFMFVLFLKLVSFYFQQTTGLFRVCILRSSKSCQPKEINNIRHCN